MMSLTVKGERDCNAGVGGRPPPIWLVRTIANLKQREILPNSRNMYAQAYFFLIIQLIRFYTMYILLRNSKIEFIIPGHIMTWCRIHTIRSSFNQLYVLTNKNQSKLL